jgi:uncharacterized radical SAM superfamily Fe-S cluster-containing enzyme
MNENTISMCEHCYRHVPANKFEKNGQVWISKTCPEHGYHECLVEIDSKFYQEQVYDKRRPNSYWLDITNRCNLDCPHCYQMPDNMSKDPSINDLIKEIIDEMKITYEKNASLTIDDIYQNVFNRVLQG